MRGFPKYVSADERRRGARMAIDMLRKEGVPVQPVRIEGRFIAATFWGKAWCDHLESFSDFENRLPRGRAYVRSGSVCHLDIRRSQVHARVQGKELYTVTIAIKELAAPEWERIKRQCTGRISSLLDLLQGRLSDGVMEVVTDRRHGLFPQPREIVMSCTCPDWAVMCKHVAAALYGVGARLDEKPELLFLLRGVDHAELVTEHAVSAVAAAVRSGRGRRIAESEIGEIFGIQVEKDRNKAPPKKAPRKKPKNQPKRPAPRAGPRRKRA